MHLTLNETERLMIEEKITQIDNLALSIRDAIYENALTLRTMHGDIVTLAQFVDEQCLPSNGLRSLGQLIMRDIERLQSGNNTENNNLLPVLFNVLGDARQGLEALLPRI